MDDYSSPPPPSAPPPDDWPPQGEAPPPPASGQQPAPQYAPPQQQPKRGSSTVIIIVVVVAVLLLCCCGVVGSILFFGESLEDVTGTSEPGGVTQTETGGATGSAPVAVWLSWPEGVDMDLEIWDASGDTQLTTASFLVGEDITDGSMGEEYFEFASYDIEDYSTGEYVVSVYYADFSDLEGEANVTLSVQKADGSTETWAKTVMWDPEFDQWHAFRIDAVTGETVEVDEFQ